jgi:hypothetical protein
MRNSIDPFPRFFVNEIVKLGYAFEFHMGKIGRAFKMAYEKRMRFVRITPEWYQLI